MSKNFTTTKSASKKIKKTTIFLIIWSVVALVLCFIILFQFSIIQSFFSNPISNGTSVNGINLSGMERGEATKYLYDYFKENAQSFSLTLKHQNKTWSLNKEDFVVNSNIHTILEASQIHEKETGTYEKQLSVLEKKLKDGSSINVAFNYIFTGLEEKIENILKEIEIEPEDSTISFHPNNSNLFEISEGKTGLKVDREELFRNINNQFLKKNQISVNIPTKSVLPTKTKEYNQSLTQKISSFSTDVSDSTGGRKENVKLALNKFNGMVLNPGEEVSFNKITGPHSMENGYKIATIIYNSRFIDGVGGGICQASTTLYNALLLANITITEVSKHTLPVRYVPLGLDAMVAEYIADLKFKNETEHPMFIKTNSNENSVSVEIYSHKIEDDYVFKTRSETLKVIPHKGDIIKIDSKKEYTDKVLFEGEQYRLTYPREGYEVKAYLQKYRNGELIEENEIRHEIYQPQPGIIIEGGEIAPSGLNIIDEEIEKIQPSEENTSSSGININDFASTIPTYICP